MSILRLYLKKRYATLPNIMKAKKKGLEVIAVDALGVDLKSGIEVLSVREPAKRVGGTKVENVDELLEKLKSVI